MSLDAEKSYGRETAQKWILRGLKLRGFTLNQNFQEPSEFQAVPRHIISRMIAQTKHLISS